MSSDDTKPDTDTKSDTDAKAAAAADIERDTARAERDRLAAMLADLVGAIEGRGQCWEHADACCREWCSRCQAEVEGDERLDLALDRAKEER